jgi:virulence-associated protein VapD
MVAGFSERNQAAYKPQRMLGHNSGRTGRMYAIVFDFDTGMLEQLYPNAQCRNAYSDVRSYLTARGFEWKQGSTYFGDPATVDAVRCVTVVQRLAAKYPWFTPSLRDIRMLRIEENNDLMMALNAGDDD